MSEQLGRTESSTLTALDAALLAVLVMTVGGGGLLLSAAESTTLVDGAIEWREDSPLRAVVRLLCLDYRFPTTHADEIKNYLLGTGAALAVLAMTWALAARSRGMEGRPPVNDTQRDADSTAFEDESAKAKKSHLAPGVGAQLLVGFYLLWSVASSRWSAAPELAAGGTLQVALFFLWSFCLAHGLSRKAARVAAYIVVAVTAVVAVIAVWYYFGRNPVIRAKFPFGNPGFLSAGLLPGMILSIALGCGAVSSLRTFDGRKIAALFVFMAVLVLSGWSFYLADTRGAMIGLAAGLLAVPFFALRRRWKVLPLAMAVLCLIPAWTYFAAAKDVPSPTGRSETLRLRNYAWSYAQQMFSEKPFTGHGQGGFVLAGDAHAVKDVLQDPLVFESRISHAHNEWLEVLSDLGAVGLALIAGALVLTLRGGMHALSALSGNSDRWTLIGLLAALVALTVEECFGVGLRIAGVPTFFYTLLGLVWAHCMAGRSPMFVSGTNSPGRRVLFVVLGGLVCLLVFVVNQADFTDARNAYRVQELIDKEDYEEAIRLASFATHRLNPQRALEGMYHLSEAHMLVARSLQARAADRETRARAAPAPDPYLLELARQDRAGSDDHCRNGSSAMRELVRRSPGYLNHGWVTYWLNVLQAGNAEARGEPRQRDQFLAAAAAALERELQRQPFEPALAVSFIQTALGTGTASFSEPLPGPVPGDGPSLADLLARPLRYHRITGAYVSLLQQLSSDPGFENQLASAASQGREFGASSSVQQDAQGQEPDTALQRWVPEKLRLLAALNFIRGEYASARNAAEQAAQFYPRLTQGTHMGAAACFAELADCRFLSDPDHPEGALESARRAIALAPESEPGRTLKSVIKHRMVEYYLAAGDEENAKKFLREIGPARAGEAIIVTELGSRYRQLAQSLLLQRRENRLMPKPVNDLVPKLQRWVARAIELNGGDYIAHFLAADLAFHMGDDASAAAHLRAALDRGLPPAEAAQFIALTREKRPVSPPLNELWNALQPHIGPTSPDGRQLR